MRNGDHAISGYFIVEVFVGNTFNNDVAIAEIIGCVSGITVNGNLSAILNCEGEGTVLNLRVVAAVVTDGDAGEVNNRILVVTCRAKGDLGVFLNKLGNGNVDISDIGFIVCGSLLGANVLCLDYNRCCASNLDHVLSVCIHLNRLTVSINGKLTVVSVKALNSNC